MKRGLEANTLTMQCVEYAYVEFPARGVWGDASSGNFWNIAITRLNLEAIFNQILYCTERLWVQDGRVQL